MTITSVIGSTALEVSGVSFDSRKIPTEGVFVAVRGTQVDGHQYIQSAIENGASAVVCEQLPDEEVPDITYIVVDNSAVALGQIAANFYGNPSEKLQLIGVTGTNGKTTVATLLHQLFTKFGEKAGLLSTVENKIADEVIAATHTTPDPVQLNRVLADMLGAGCTYAFMEVSSHAIHQHRISGLQFAGGVFTNISHDHLDYHKTFDEYIRVKKMFFDDLPKAAFALANLDDKRGDVMLQNTYARKRGYALRKAADYHAKIIDNTVQGLQLRINGHDAWFKLVGTFNAYNLLAVYGVAEEMGKEPAEILLHLSGIQGAKGRFETMVAGNGITGIIDYAHTPDALDNVLQTIAGLKKKGQKVITVVGCGGNRDKTKRPEMAQIGAKLSDQLIITSDNPRDEDPETIIREMEAGLSPLDFKKSLSITDRKEAIKTACKLADKDDIILIAGKGHENYQEIKGVKHHFDDKEVFNEVMNMIC